MSVFPESLNLPALPVSGAARVRVMPLFLLRLGPGLLLLPPAVAAAVPYTHWEGRQTHPVAVSPDGTRLYAVNTPDSRLSVFDISNPARHAPLLIAEIPVGLEPVSVRVRGNGEVWVVNELSDSVSVVDVARRVTVGTLSAADEPADVVFAGDKAFVSCARNSRILVFDAASRTQTAVIPLEGNFPRALTVNADGSLIYAACLLSGNRTTILPADQAPAPPAPSNPALPGAPGTALIVPAADPRVSHTVLDHDVAEISVASHSVLRWLEDAGTHLFDVAVHPVDGALWVANSESLNLVRFEPALKGHFIDHRLTRYELPSGARTVHDLNPGTDYQTLPNPASRATALAQPAALVFQPDGQAVWVAAFNSDLVAKIGPDGTVLARVEVRLPPEPVTPGGPVPANDSTRMRGPRGLAVSLDGSRLYVLNKLSNTISVLDTATAAVLTEVAAGSWDPTPAAIRAGRGFLFDARLSGNGTNSCASCHLDADTDGLAWDLGDPGGALITVSGQNLSIHDLTPRDRVMHPMKGPMVTQTLRGLQPVQKLHWRGDRATLADFNATYRDLMGGSLIQPAEIEALHGYLLTLRHHPNPNRTWDNGRPSALEGGDANAGRLIYLNHNKSHCAICHILPTGSDDNIDLMQEVASTQPVKTPPLRTVYQRSAFSRAAGARNVAGFGLLKDGTGTFASLPTSHEYALADFQTAQELTDVRAFVLSFDTGTPPITGFSRTVSGIPAAGSPAETDLDRLEARAGTPASAPDCDLVVRGLVEGAPRQFVWDRGTMRYLPDRAGGAPMTRAVLLSRLQPGDSLTFTAFPSGAGAARGRDRNEDGVLDGDAGPPVLEITLRPGPDPGAGLIPLLSWPVPAADWYPESGVHPGTVQWQPFTAPAVSGARPDGSTWWQAFPDLSAASRFFRLRRTW